MGRTGTGDSSRGQGERKHQLVSMKIKTKKRNVLATAARAAERATKHQLEKTVVEGSDLHPDMRWPQGGRARFTTGVRR